MSYTSLQKGSLRDSLIVRAIEANKVLTTEQVELLFFKGLNSSKRIAQRRLKALYDKKIIRRDRHSIDQPYYYFTKKVDQLEHSLAVSWIYVWFALRLANWEQLIYFKTEDDYGIVRADAFVGIKNGVTGSHNYYFVELDLAENAMDKIQKYNSLYQSEKYLTRWWVKHASRFPQVIIVTGREKLVRKKIEKENTNNLEFKVCSPEEIRKECYKWSSCN